MNNTAQVADAIRDTKPARNAEVEKVRAAVADYLDTPDSFPLIVPEIDGRMQDRLDAQDAKARSRRFDDKAVITGFGEFA